jgi:hypothetical protein
MLRDAQENPENLINSLNNYERTVKKAIEDLEEEGLRGNDLNTSYGSFVDCGSGANSGQHSGAMVPTSRSRRNKQEEKAWYNPTRYMK